MYFNLYGCKVYILLINSNSNSNRVSSSHLPDEEPQQSLASCDVFKLVQLSDSDIAIQKQVYKSIAAHILCEYIPTFKFLKDLVTHFDVPMQHKVEMQQKSLVRAANYCRTSDNVRLNLANVRAKVILIGHWSDHKKKLSHYTFFCCDKIRLQIHSNLHFAIRHSSILPNVASEWLYKLVS